MFVKFYCGYYSHVYVNSDQVTSVDSGSRDRESYIWLSNGNKIIVNESSEEVVKKLSGTDKEVEEDMEDAYEV